MIDFTKFYTLASNFDLIILPAVEFETSIRQNSPVIPAAIQSTKFGVLNDFFAVQSWHIKVTSKDLVASKAELTYTSPWDNIEAFRTLHYERGCIAKRGSEIIDIIKCSYEGFHRTYICRLARAVS